ncbi:MAG: class II fructose-bisphosphate aldolase [Anaerolineaceae bacterium]|nr:class II fructose-bisphosphate aldolase [Anaerolineaceae bacterium]
MAHQIFTLKDLLPVAQRNHFAVGAFSARFPGMIEPILRAAVETRSPVIVQISQVEFSWYQISPAYYAGKFYEILAKVSPDVPVCLHLDHTTTLDLIQEAVAAGFSSVMIDASAKPLEENIACTRQVVALAKQHGISVEAELGKILSSDKFETTSEEEIYTDPVEAERFVGETGVDALAISIGTVHSIYYTRQPKIDFERLAAIRERVQIPLVLHGGSGVPSDQVKRAIQLRAGGVSKINIATELENALYASLELPERITNAEFWQLSTARIARAQDAVKELTKVKINDYLLSAGAADLYNATPSRLASTPGY